MADIDIIDRQIAELEAERETMGRSERHLKRIKRRCKTLESVDPDQTTLVIDKRSPRVPTPDSTRHFIAVEVTTENISRHIQRLLDCVEWDEANIDSTIEVDADGDDATVIHTLNLHYVP